MLLKQNRLKKQNNFKKVFKQGRHCACQFIFLKILKNDLDDSRFGFIVSNKISKKAVERNKIKRRLRDIVRCSLSETKSGYDVIIAAKPGIEKLGYNEMKAGLLGLFKKVGIINNSKCKMQKSKCN